MWIFAITSSFRSLKATPRDRPKTRRNVTAPRIAEYNGMFNRFSAIDRQTELTDDDGSLTGYAKTSSVNDQDNFFTAPIDGLECQSDGAVPEGGTARTSPYDYVTTVVYPDDAQYPRRLRWFRGAVCWKNPNPAQPPDARQKIGAHPNPNWDSACTDHSCFGVPLYRLYQTGSEKSQKKVPEFIRMAGFNICQRQTMTVNHGLYYVDLTASAKTQNAWAGGTPKKTSSWRGTPTTSSLSMPRKIPSKPTRCTSGPEFR